MQYYKHLSITFLTTTIWCVYVFFDYYSDRSFMPGLTLYTDYLFSTILVLSLSVILFFLSFSKYRAVVLNSFFYIFSAVSNIFLAVVYSLQLVFSNSVKEFFSTLEYINLLVYLLLIFGIYFIIDLYRFVDIKPLSKNKNLKPPHIIDENYKAALYILHGLLIESGNEHWAESIKKDIYLWETRNSVTHHLRSFGGMGSINDLCIGDNDVIGVWKSTLFDITKTFSWSLAKKKITPPNEIFNNDKPNEISGWRCIHCGHARIATMNIEHYLAATMLPDLFVKYALENRLIDILELKRITTLDSIVRTRERIKGLVQSNNITLSLNNEWLTVCPKCGINDVCVYRWKLENNDAKLVAAVNNLKIKT